MKSHSTALYFPGIILEVDIANSQSPEDLRKQGLLWSVFLPQGGNRGGEVSFVLKGIHPTLSLCP